MRNKEYMNEALHRGSVRVCHPAALGSGLLGDLAPAGYFYSLELGLID